MSKENHCIIFIPGFKGSILYNQNETWIWPNFLRAQISDVTLNYDLPELGLPNNSQFHATDIVRSIPIVPFIYNFDIYGNFINELTHRCGKEIKLITFFYDWRDDLIKTVLKLNDLILQLKNSGINKIKIICHSMGGLITAYLLRYGNNNLNIDNKEWNLTSIIHKVIFVATPFNGTIRSLYDVTYGTKLGINHSLLSPNSLQTFPSTYYLLPFYKNALTISNNTNTERSLLDVTTWQQYKLGLLNNVTSNDSMLQNRINYLQQCLSAANQFHTMLYNETKVQPEKNIEIVLIKSDSFKSLYSLDINEKSKKFVWNYKKGDGSISFCATELPPAFKNFTAKNFLVNAEHSKIFLSKEVQEILWREIEAS